MTFNMFVYFLNNTQHNTNKFQHEHVSSMHKWVSSQEIQQNILNIVRTDIW